MKRIVLKRNCIQPTPQNSFIIDYLGSLGIAPNDAESFINQPRDTDEENPKGLNNINEAITAVYKAAQADKKFFVQVDADTDGYTSGAIFIGYMKRRFPNIRLEYRLHDGKQHGVIMETVPADADVIIIPDAGSNQCAEQRELVAMGKTVVILDHHEINYELFSDGGAIIVNNQDSPNFANKNLSGAGVVYKFIQYMDMIFYPADKIYKDFSDLAAIGIIADSMNMLQLDNNKIAFDGLNNIKSKIIRQIAVNQSRGIKDPDHLTKIDVAFYIAPVINGVIRSGDEEDKSLLFRAMVDNNNHEEFHTTWRGKERYETLYEIAARLAGNAKSRQDASKKKSFEWLCDKIKQEHLDKDNIIVVTLNEKESAKVSPNVTGLIAMELVKAFNRPCCVLRETKEEDGSTIFGGSGRNGNFYNFPNMLDFLHSTGCVEYAEGHQGAHGIFLKPEQVQQLRDYANTHIDANGFNEKVYDVDYWFHTGEVVNYDMLMEFAKYDYLYGNSIPQPKFAIDVNFAPEDVSYMGAEKTTVKINVDGVPCISFNNSELASQLYSMPHGGHATIIGRPQINEWMNRRTVQLMIDDIEISESIDYSASVKESVEDLI